MDAEEARKVNYKGMMQNGGWCWYKLGLGVFVLLFHTLTIFLSYFLFPFLNSAWYYFP